MLAAKKLHGVGLVDAEDVAVGAGILAVLIAISLARRARYRVDRSVRRRGAGFVRVARIVAWGGLYVACIGALSLAFYGVLVLRS